MTTPGAEVSLSPVVERLLLDVVADGFVLYCCGHRTDPSALVACYEWAHCVDLVTIRDFERVTTARVPKRDKSDVFAPEVVVWADDPATDTRPSRRTHSPARRHDPARTPAVAVTETMAPIAGKCGLVADDQLPVCGVGGARYSLPAAGRSGS